MDMLVQLVERWLSIRQMLSILAHISTPNRIFMNNPMPPESP
jgi:hypothetical protein